MRASNPAIRKFGGMEYAATDETARASYKGVAWKSVYFVLLTMACAVASGALLLWLAESGNVGGLTTFIVILIVSIIAAVVCGLVAAFAPSTVRVTGPLYAIFEGVVVGAVSAILGAAYGGGIVLAALGATFGAFLIMTVLYATGVIKVSQKFKSFMISALISIVLIGIIIYVVGIFVPGMFDLLYGTSWISIGISAFMCLFASFFILIDLSNIDEIVKGGLDKKWEWNAAFGLTITLIWLYLEFLRLFAKLAARGR